LTAPAGGEFADGEHRRGGDVATVETAEEPAALLGDLAAVDPLPTPLVAPATIGSSKDKESVMAERGSKRLRATALVALMAAVLLFLAVPARASSPVNLTFEKEAVAPGAWEGTVSGDINGDLKSFLTACTGPNPCSGRIWHVEFDWVIDAGAESFTAHLSGVLNNVTGSVVMNGRVVDGFLEGAQVHEAGQLVNAETLGFEGTIRIMPATA
jgi:hypothetical protein